MKKEPNLLFDDQMEEFSNIPWITYISGSMVVHIVAVIGLSMLTSFFPKNNQQKQILIPVDVVTLKTKDTPKNNNFNKPKANRNNLANQTTKSAETGLQPEKYVIKPPDNIPTFSELEIPRLEPPKRNDNNTIPRVPNNNINSASIPESKGITSIPDNWNININGNKRVKTELFNTQPNSFLNNNNFSKNSQRNTVGSGTKYPQITLIPNAGDEYNHSSEKNSDKRKNQTRRDNLFPIPSFKNNQNSPENNSLNNPISLNANPQAKLPPIKNNSLPIFSQNTSIIIPPTTGILNSNQTRKNIDISVNNNSKNSTEQGINIPVIRTNINANKKNKLPAKIAGLLPDPNAPNLTVSTKTVPKQSLNVNETELNKSAKNTSGILIANLIDHRLANNGKDLPDTPAMPRQKQLIDTDYGTQSLLGNGGEVWLKIKLRIDKKGRAFVVKSPQVLKGVVKGNPEQLVRNMMENWPFEPARQRGQSVESLLEVTIQLKTNSQ